MKKILLPFVFLLLTKNIFGQPDRNVGKYFQFLENIQLQKCDAIGGVIAGTVVILRGIQFRIDATAGNDYVIHILRKGGDVTFNTKYFLSTFAVGITKPQPDIYFLLPASLFNSKCKLRLTKNSFTIGLVNLPIKMRFGGNEKENGNYSRNFLLTSDVSLGLSLGYKRKWNDDWGINFLGGISLSSIEVDSSTTKGYAKSASNISSLTGHVGLLLENNNFQFGVFTGIDFLTGEVGRNWAYRKKPWLGIAIGFSLFKTKSPTDTQKD
jgi:hypothetical protein